MSITSDRIKQSRKDKGMTMDEFASAMGVKSQRTIVNWENGTIKLKEDKLQKIAKVLDVSVPYLTGFTNVKKYESQGFDTVEEFEKNRQNLLDEHKYNPHTGSELKQTFSSGKVLKNIEVIETDIRDRYKEVAKNLASDLSDENNEKWLEYGRLLIQEQNRKENLL
ncbi:helix-turn-helix domain-containing protein [Lactococcus petauri]|uniref:helix-turn-helix domain-containing protein n=1 Tax=Lactococcus petauri TaxID=1940789 RepID=UPI003877A7C2